MRRIGLVRYALFVVLAATVFAAPAAQAQDRQISDAVGEFLAAQAAMNDLRAKIDAFQPAHRRYCRPPVRPNKAGEQALLATYESQLRMAKNDIMRTAAEIEAYASQPGAVSQIIDAGLPGSVNPADPAFWNGERRKIQPHEAAMKRAHDRLAQAPEARCRGSAPQVNAATLTGPTTPAAPPAPPPPPPLPDRPSYAPYSWPTVPDHFCNEAERWKWIAEVLGDLLKVIDGNGEKASVYRTAVGRAADEAAARGDKAKARALREEFLRAYQDWVFYSEEGRKWDRVRSQAIQVPLKDCTEKTEDEPKGAIKTGMSFPYTDKDGLLAFGGSVDWTRTANLAFLGRETPGDPAPRLGLFPAEDRLTSTRYAIEAGFRLDSASGLLLGLGLSGGKAKAETSYAALDLMGDRLVIPGLGVGPNGNGFVLNYNAGLNTPNNATAWREHEGWELRAGLTLPVTTEWGGYALSAGVGYEKADYYNSFTASVPGFLRDIGYTQSIEETSFNLYAGLSAETPICDSASFGLEGEAGLRFSRFEGMNRLDFTGFDPQIVDDRRDVTSFQLRAGAKLNWSFAPGAAAELRGDLTWRDGVPVWETPGGGARARIGTGDALSGRVGLGLRFTF